MKIKRHFRLGSLLVSLFFASLASAEDRWPALPEGYTTLTDLEGVGGGNNNAQIYAPASDGQTFELNVVKRWYGVTNNSTTNAARLHITSWVVAAVEENLTLTINSQVTGEGSIGYSVNNNRNYNLTFAGDMSYFYGDFYNGEKDGGVITERANSGFNLTFNGTQTADTAPTWATSASGHGAIDLGDRNLTYNFTSAGSTPGVALINNSYIDVQNATLGGDAAYSISSDFTADLLTLNNGNHTTLSGSSITIDTVAINTGSTLNIGSTEGAGFSAGSTLGSLQMAAGSTLHINIAEISLSSLQASGAVTVSTASATEATISALSFADSASTLTLASGSTLTLGGTISFSNKEQITAQGTLSFAADVLFDINAVDLSQWEHNVDTNTYTLQLFSGAGVTGFESLTEDNLIYDAKDLFDIRFDADGSIYYTLASMDFESVTGDGIWGETAIDGLVFSNGQGVNFTADAALDISGSVTSAQIIVDAGKTLTLSQHTDGGTLHSPLIQLQGTLALSEDGILTEESVIHFRSGGTLKLGNNVTLNSSITSVGGAAMQFDVTDATATLTQQLTGSTSMSVTGNGSLNLSGALLAGASTTTIAAGSTLRIGSGSNSTDLKNIRGAGTLIFAGNHGSTRLDVNEFTGAIELVEGATGLRLSSNQGSGTRFSLENTSSSAVAVSLYGTADPGTNGLMLNKLEGNINFSASGDHGTNDYERNHVDLEMSADHRWTGTWASTGTNNGYLVVGSAGATRHTFTITQGQKDNTNDGRWNRLEIDHAKVVFEESAEWKGAIKFDHSDAVLELKGNSITFDTDERSDQMANFQSSAEGHGEIIVNVGAANTVTINQTNNSDNDDDYNSGSNAYSGAITVQSGTLVLEAANAFDHVDSVTVHSNATLNMNNVVHNNNVHMQGGTFTKADEWTGNLTLAANAAASVTNSHIATNTIALGADATLSLQNSMIGAGKLSGTSNNTVNLHDSGIVFDADTITFATPPSSAPASAEPSGTARELEQITDTSLETMLLVTLNTSWTDVESLNVSGDLYLELNLTDEQFALFDSRVLTTGVAFALQNDPNITLDMSGLETVYLGLKSGDRYELHSSQKYATEVGSVQYMIVVPVPEPSTGVMSLLALTTLLARRRRRS